MTQFDERSDQSRSEILISAVVMNCGDPELQREIEEFRLEYERLHGRTDLSLPYSSVLSSAEQSQLLEQDSVRYFNDLPEFGQAFILSKLEIAQRIGKLDDMPTPFIGPFMLGKLAVRRQP